MNYLLIPYTKMNNQLRIDLLETALYGGSNYWYWLSDESHDIVMKYGETENGSFSEKMMAAINAGENIKIHDAEEFDEDNLNECLLGIINLESIVKGEKIMRENPKYVRHYADAISEMEGDSTTADVWFQLCVMGELVFG